MKIANVQESSAPSSRDVFVGVENFYAVAVNPTLAELQAMGIPATEPPVYFGKLDRDGLSYDYFSVRVFLDNKDTVTPIKTQVQYTVLKDHQLSATNKYRVINKYGDDAWLADENAALPSNMEWYLDDDLKKCYRGEESLLAFIKALRNLPNITKVSTQDQKDAGVAQFMEEDLTKMFNGNFTDIKNVINDSAAVDCKVGFLMGVRFQDDNPRQTLYSKMPLKSYIKSTDNTAYIVKQVKNAQDNGSMTDYIFDLQDTKLKVYDAEAVKPTDTPMYDATSTTEDDDLPF